MLVRKFTVFLEHFLKKESDKTVVSCGCQERSSTSLV